MFLAYDRISSCVVVSADGQVMIAITDDKIILLPAKNLLPLDNLEPLMLLQITQPVDSTDVRPARSDSIELFEIYRS